MLEKIAELGLVLPRVSPPIASYVPAVRDGSLIFVSGQLPMKDEAMLMTGQMNRGRQIETAQAAMEQCFLNGIAAALLVCKPEELKRVIKLGAYVASSPDFIEQHKVANGASDIAKKIFGDAGIHSRFAVGVQSLPLDATVELEIIFGIA